MEEKVITDVERNNLTAMRAYIIDTVVMLTFTGSDRIADMAVCAWTIHIRSGSGGTGTGILEKRP